MHISQFQSQPQNEQSYNASNFKPMAATPATLPFGHRIGVKYGATYGAVKYGQTPQTRALRPHNVSNSSSVSIGIIE